MQQTNERELKKTKIEKNRMYKLKKIKRELNNPKLTEQERFNLLMEKFKLESKEKMQTLKSNRKGSG